MSLWIDDPSVLLSAELPWCSLNAVARIYLLVGLVWSIVARSVIPFLVLTGMALVTTLLIERQRNRQQSAAPKISYSRAPLQQQQQRATMQSTRYLNNPMPWTGALPTTVGPFSYGSDNELQRMYQPVDVWPEGWFINPVPDPTLTARQPFFWQSSEVDRLPWADQGNMRYMR